MDGKTKAIAWGIILRSRCDARVEESCRVALDACHSPDIKGDRFLNHFSMVTTVGAPQTVAAQEMCIERLLPPDEATASHHIALMSAGQPSKSVCRILKEPRPRLTSGSGVCMTETTTNNCETTDRDVRRTTRPFAGIIVLLVCLTVLITFSVAGDWLENSMTLTQADIKTLAQEEIAPSCPVPATLRFSLAGLAREGETAPRSPKSHFIKTRHFLRTTD